MARYCEVCGGRLRTGTKYCFRCRSLGRYNQKDRKIKEKPINWTLALWAACIMTLLLLIVIKGLEGLIGSVFLIIIFLAIWLSYKKRNERKV